MLKKLYLDGASYKDIAKIMGISRASVYRKLKKENIVNTRRDPDGRWDNATDAELREEITAVHAPVVTADEVMSTPSSLDELDKQVFGS